VHPQFIYYRWSDHANHRLYTYYLEKNLEIVTQEAEQEKSIALHYANKLGGFHR